MKKLFLISLIITVNISILIGQENESEPRVAEVTLETNMECSVCENKVRQQLAYTRGVIDIDTDIETNTVVVKYRTRRTDVEKIIKSLAEIDFEAKEKKEKHQHIIRVPGRSCCLY